MKSLGSPTPIPLRIHREKNLIDDGFLDLIGREITSHEQGLAEWLKNGADAVLAAGFVPGRESIFLRFTDGNRGTPAVFECVDFVGMTLRDIETRFKPWGRLSRPGERPGCYGGYGIGGKFYMRQMFVSSHLITYTQGFLNIFGFDRCRAYGYARGYRNRPMDPEDALCLADAECLAEWAGLKGAVIAGKRGFSVFRGMGPRGMGKRLDVDDLCERLRYHPQAQGPLKSLRVWVIHNGSVAVERLQPRSIPRRPGFESPWIRKVPPRLPGVDGKALRLSGNSKAPGDLRLSVADESLVQKGKMASLNRIDFRTGDGIVASYRLDELGVDVPYGDSIFGECVLFVPGHDARRQWGKRTRQELVESPETRALLLWVRSQVTLFSRVIQRKVAQKEGKSLVSHAKDG